jgi:hypothetical protein
MKKQDNIRMQKQGDKEHTYQMVLENSGVMGDI